MGRKQSLPLTQQDVICGNTQMMPFNFFPEDLNQEFNRRQLRHLPKGLSSCLSHHLSQGWCERLYVDHHGYNPTQITYGICGFRKCQTSCYAPAFTNVPLVFLLTGTSPGKKAAFSSATSGAGGSLGPILNLDHLWLDSSQVSLFQAFPRP